MAVPATPEGNNGTSETSLASRLAQETKTMVAKLKDLKLDDPSAPGMFVFGQEAPIAILLGRVGTPIDPSVERPNDLMRAKHLVIAPQGFFLAEGSSDVMPTQEEALSLTLNDAGKSNGQQAINVSIDDKGLLRIDSAEKHQAFKMQKISTPPEIFSQIVRSAVENSRKIRQESLMNEIARGKAGNSLLDNMIQQENPSLPPTTQSVSPQPSAAAGSTTQA